MALESWRVLHIIAMFQTAMDKIEQVDADRWTVEETARVSDALTELGDHVTRVFSLVLSDEDRELMVRTLGKIQDVVQEELDDGEG